MDQRSPAILEFFSNGKMQPSMPQPLKKFYKGEPMALGITQIFIGILEIAFGLVVAFMKHPTNFDVHFSNPYWMGIVYIFSGTLSVTASKDPKIPLVKWMLGMNVVSVVVAGIEIVMLSVSVARPTYYFTCKSYYNRDIPPEICHEVYTIPYVVMYRVIAILLAFNILEFLIAITTSAFGCASMCRDTYSETTIVIFQNAAEAAVPASGVPSQTEEDEVP